MPAANVPMVIDQDEDYTSQLVVTDTSDEPLKLIAPARLDVKDEFGQTVLTLTTPETTLEDGQIPEIGISSDIGLIQLHIENTVTKAISAGIYHYDLFVTVNDGWEYAGNQRIRLVYGTCQVNKRITQM